MESLFINKFHAIYAAIDIFSIMLWSDSSSLSRLPLRFREVPSTVEKMLGRADVGEALKIKLRVYDCCYFRGSYSRLFI